jgi:signal peptidase I
MTTDDAGRPGTAASGAADRTPDRPAVPDPEPGAAAEPAASTSRRESAPPRRRPKKRGSFWRELPGIVITALVISVLIKTFLVQAFYIPSGSMENTLLVNDRVLVNKLADKPDEIRRGDVVVFRDPGGWLGGTTDSGRGGIVGLIRDVLVFVGLAPAPGEEDLIKRVIGVAGDTVVCCDDGGKLLLNDVPLDEPYLYPGDDPSEVEFEITVPKDRLWVMGDHRSVSEDSRAHRQQPGEGFVPVEDVLGRAFTVVWPLDRAGVMRRPAVFERVDAASSR